MTLKNTMFLLKEVTILPELNLMEQDIGLEILCVL